MTYKLHIERRHRVAHGGAVAGKVVKRQPDGRVIRSTYDADADQIIYHHATRGVLRRSRAIVLNHEERVHARR
jgi:hypothetical protein